MDWLPTLVALALVALAAAWWRRAPPTPGEPAKPARPAREPLPPGMPLRIAFASQTGTAQRFAEALQAQAETRERLVSPRDAAPVDLGAYDPYNLEQEQLLVCVVSTWSGGQPPASAAPFFAWLEDQVQDFRVPRTLLQGLRFAVLGLGGEVYDADFCRAAATLHEQLEALGARPLCEVARADDQSDQEGHFAAWSEELWRTLQVALRRGTKTVKGAKRPKRRRRQQQAAGASAAEEPLPMTEEDRINLAYVAEDLTAEERKEYGGEEPAVADIEALAAATAPSTGAKKRQMVTPIQRRNLTKQGYKLIGHHSAVKLCRWTKSHVRGRGACYKYTCYGITSSRCMEATPSLACSSKCVFCWRGHTNPVSRDWRWEADDPHDIVAQAIDRHRGMIKEMRGVPGARPDRLAAALDVKHCALSLVGEPIMYPEINTLVRDLHGRSISTFVVCNAQHPDRLAQLEPVTQLYVSIDAATKESLRAVDRPLHGDFWERFLACLDLVRDVPGRTVFRLTLVKAFNMDEVREYVELVRRAQPDFIEIKGMTFSGDSASKGLTMDNAPYHEDVRAFSEAIAELADGYDVACEHEHSNLVLLAREAYRAADGDGWNTWIDYDRFHELARRFYADGTPFSGLDYMAPTPDWAVYGAPEQGFSPDEVRHKRMKGGRMVPLASAEAQAAVAAAAGQS